MRLMSAAPGSLPSTPGPSKNAGRSSKRGSDRNAEQPSSPSSPSPGGACLAVGPERRLRVVHVDAGEPLDPEPRHVLVDHLGETVVVADVEPAGQHVARVEADADALVPTGAVHDVVQLGERAPDRAARASGVLEQEPAALGLRQSLAHHRAHAAERPGKRVLQARARVHHHAVGADRVAHPQGVHERCERLLAHLPVLGGAVDQVDRMDHDRLDRAIGHQLAEALDVRVLPLRRPPHARRLVEHLDRVAAALDPALMRVHEAAGRRDMGAD